MQRYLVVLLALLLSGALASTAQAEPAAPVAQTESVAPVIPAEATDQALSDESLDPLGPLALRLRPACESGANRRFSGAALVLALREKRWIIRGADLVGGRVSARACSLRTCVTIDAAIGEQGFIDIAATKRSRGEEVVTDLPRNWERHLTHAYEGFSCYPSAQLFDLYDQHRYPRTSAPDLDR